MWWLVWLCRLCYWSGHVGVVRDCVVCLVVSSLLLIWSGGCREGLCGVFGCVVFVIDLVMWVS